MLNNYMENSASCNLGPRLFVLRGIIDNFDLTNFHVDSLDNVYHVSDSESRCTYT